MGHRNESRELVEFLQEYEEKAFDYDNELFLDQLDSFFENKDLSDRWFVTGPDMSDYNEFKGRDEAFEYAEGMLENHDINDTNMVRMGIVSYVVEEVDDQCKIVKV